MRDPKRIRQVLARLEWAWERRPDLRLGQIIVNAAGLAQDPFYIEDEELIKRIERDLLS